MYYLDGRYYAFFTGYNGTVVGINEATSTDALHWHQLGRVIPGTKNAAVIADPQGRPVKIDGSYLMYYGETDTTHLAKSTDLTTGPPQPRSIRASLPATPVRILRCRH